MLVSPSASWSAVRDDVVRHRAARDFDVVFENIPAIAEELGRMHASFVQQGPFLRFSFFSWYERSRKTSGKARWWLSFIKRVSVSSTGYG